jgi:hypothetical protein
LGIRRREIGQWVFDNDKALEHRFVDDPAARLLVCGKRLQLGNRYG